MALSLTVPFQCHFQCTHPSPIELSIYFKFSAPSPRSLPLIYLHNVFPQTPHRRRRPCMIFSVDWALKTNYLSVDDKHRDNLAKQMPGLHSPMMNSRPLGRTAGGAADASSVSSLPVSESEDDLNGKAAEGQRRNGLHYQISVALDRA